MPITLNDIEVPVIPCQREGDTVIDHYCTLCNETVGYDHHFQPQSHTLDECLMRFKERLNALPK